MGKAELMEEVVEQIVLAERVNSAVAEANSFRLECGRVGMLVNRLSLKLQELGNLILQFSDSPQLLYDRPIVAVVAEVSRNLRRGLTLVRKCKRWGLLRWFRIGNRKTDFGKVSTFLESSIGDLEWLLCLFGGDDGDRVISLPPIAIHDPVLPWVWYSIAALKIGKSKDRIDAANDLASLAKDNERNKRIIKEEGGIPPLLKLLGEELQESQIAAVDSLRILSNNQDIARTITKEIEFIPSVVKLLRASTTKVQIAAAQLVARIAENNAQAQNEFAEAHVTGPLLKLLSFDVIPDENNAYFCKKKQSITNSENHTHSCKFLNVYLNWYFEGSERARVTKKDWEMENPEAKFQLKMNCSEALWVLAQENVLVCKNIIERNGLISLVKLIEVERGELRYNCLMIIVEIAAIAEGDQDFRHSVIKNDSSSMKALINQLLKVIEECEDERLQISAIRSIGSLARIFPAKEIRVIKSLVRDLSNTSSKVAEEAIRALQKFVCADNYLRSEHSESIFKLHGLTALQQLDQKANLEAGVLLRAIGDATSAGSVERADRWSMSEEMERARRRVRRSQQCPFMGFRPFHFIAISLHDLLDVVESGGKLVLFPPCSPLRKYE